MSVRQEPAGFTRETPLNKACGFDPNMITNVKHHVLERLTREEQNVGQYKVIFYGLAVAGPEEEARLLKGIQKKFNLTQERAERLLQRVPIVVKKGTSLEEMEKYMKAFQEIGGKVKLEEEEPVLEFQEAPETSEPETKGFAGKMMTCPQCASEQPETNACVKCGLEFARYEPYKEMASSFREQARAIPSEGKEASAESGEGFFGAFFRTTRDVLFSPVQFFRRSAAGEGYGFPLIYGLITGIIGMGGSMVWQYILFAKLFHFWNPPDIPYSFELIAATLALPLAVLGFIFLGTVVTHFCLFIVGGNKMGFHQTFRAITYSYGAQLFGIIPFIGGTIGSIYTLILVIIGVKEGHGISTARAILAVLFPVIVVIILGIIAAIFIPLFVGSLRMFGGIGI